MPNCGAFVQNEHTLVEKKSRQREEKSQCYSRFKRRLNLLNPEAEEGLAYANKIYLIELEKSRPNAAKKAELRYMMNRYE